MNQNHYNLLVIVSYHDQMGFDIPCQTFTELQAKISVK